MNMVSNTMAAITPHVTRMVATVVAAAIRISLTLIVFRS